MQHGLVHPRTGKLLEPIGIWRGRLVWPVMGASQPTPPPPSPAPEPAPPAPPAPTPAPTPTPPAPPPAPSPAPELAPPKETDWQAEARKWEQRAKENREKAKKFDEFEAANQTELEKATKTATEAEERARAATLRAVTGEVKALAEKFTDREDAVLNLGDLTRFVGDDGEIDTKTIGTELDAVLKSKPHLGKPEPPKPGGPTPRPVPSLRPGAAADEPARAANLTDAINARFAPPT